jgi:hypothetical protein
MRVDLGHATIQQGWVEVAVWAICCIASFGHVLIMHVGRRCSAMAGRDVFVVQAAARSGLVDLLTCCNLSPDVLHAGPLVLLHRPCRDRLGDLALRSCWWVLA